MKSTARSGPAQPRPRAASTRAGRAPSRLAAAALPLLLLALATLFPACETTSNASAGAASDAAAAAALGSPAAMTLSEGDVVRVSFPGSPELDAVQRIRADGGLSLPLIGEVKAAGKPIEQLERELRAKYASNLRDTEVIVSLDDTAAAIYVSGAVNKPGKYPLTRPMSVLEAIMEAGGFGPTASPKRVTLIRRDGGQQRSQVLDLSPALQNRPLEVAYVRPYDVIYVQQSYF